MNTSSRGNGRLYKTILLIVSLVAVLIFAIIPLQRRISQRLVVLKGETVDYIEDYFDRRISYDSIAPSILRYIEIRGLKVHSQDNQKDAILSISRIRVFYRLGKLLKGNRTDVIREIRIENSSFFVDLEQDRDLIDLVIPDNTGPAALPDITISGRNLTLGISSGENSGRIEKLFFNLKPADESLEIQGKFEGTTVLDPSLIGISELSTGIRVSGVLARDYSKSDLKIRLKDINSPVFTLDSITLHAEHTGTTIALRKIQDKAPFDITLNLDTQNQSAKVSFSAENFMPDTYITPGMQVAEYAPWFSTIISGNASAEYTLETKEITYDTELSMRLDNKMLPTVFSVQMDASGNLNEIFCRRLLVQSVYGQWGFRGSLTAADPFPVPEGTLWLENVPIGDARLNSIMTIADEGSYLSLRSSHIEIGGITLKKTLIDLVPYEDDIDFLISTYLGKDDENPLFNGEGNLQLRPGLFLQASAALEELPVAPVAELFTGNRRITELTESMVFSTQVLISTDFNRFSFTTSGVELIDTTIPDNRATLALSGNNSGFNLDNIDLAWNEARLIGSASLDMAEQGIVLVDASFVYRETPYNIAASWDPDLGLVLDGRYGLNATLQPAGSIFRFQVSCENLPVPVKEGTSYITIRTDGMFDTSGIREISLRQCIITGLPLPVPENRLVFSGKIDPEQIIFYQIAYTDSYSAISGKGVLDTSLMKNEGEGWLELSDAKNSERYMLQLSRGDTLNAEIELSKAPIGRFFTGNLSGLAEGSVRVYGNPENPNIDLDAAVEGGQFNGDPFSGALSLRYNGTLLNASDVELRFMNNTLENASFRYDLSSGGFNGNGDIRGTMRSEIIGARINISGAAIPATTILDVPGIIKEKIEGNLEITNIQKGESIIEPWLIAYVSKNESFSVQGGPAQSLEATIFGDNQFQLELSDPLPIRGTARGRIEKSTIDAEITDVGLDVKILDTIMRMPQFRFIEGNAEGYLRVSGSFNDPEIWGTLRATDILAENPFVAEKIGPFNAVLEFSEKSLLIQNLILSSGEARAVADVTFDIDHWVTDTMEIDLQTISREGVHIVNSFGRMNVDGYARGHLNFQGDPNIVYLTGTLEALSTVVTIQSPEERNNNTGRRAKFFSADVTLTTGKGVEFLWPSRNLPVLRTFAETGEVLEVSYDNTKDQYTVRGEIGIKGGQIYYVQRNFYIRDGTIVFNENQDKFDPLLSTTAEIREITPEGESAKIFLIVEENSLSTFQPRFESEPSMSTADIFSLLGGQLFYASGSEGMDLSQAVAITGDFVGQFGLIRSFEERVKSIFNIDLFSIRTPVVSNFLLEKILPTEAEEQYSEPETLGKYLDNTTLFLGKYFGNDLFLQAILRLDFYDQLAGRVDASNDMFLDTEITLEWKTPVTLIEFSLFPDVTSEAGEILNPSLGLSWRYSY